MEIAGAALGTLIARGAEFITTFFYILVKDKSLGLRICHLIKSPSAAFYRSYFRLGAPVLVSDSLLGLGGNIVSVVLGHMGAAVVASNAICQVVDRLCTVVIQGVSMRRASSPDRPWERETGKRPWSREKRFISSVSYLVS